MYVLHILKRQLSGWNFFIAYLNKLSKLSSSIWAGALTQIFGPRKEMENAFSISYANLSFCSLIKQGKTSFN